MTDGAPTAALIGGVDVIDTMTAHPARVYNRWLGGKDNFAADRLVADAIVDTAPAVRAMARANRDFVLGAVRRLVTEFGVTQFLDIGSGIPAATNVHEVAQEIAPRARVVYVDSDPLVGAHCRALQASGPAGAVDFVLGDARDPVSILGHPLLAQTLDLTRPVGLLLASVLMYFPDEVAYDIAGRLLDGLPPGSFLTISHPTADFDPELVKKLVEVAANGGLTFICRSEDEVARFFAGLDVIAPGVVPMLDWAREERDIHRDSRSVFYWAGMARKR